MGVYAAMSVTGGVVGLLAGGLLVSYATRRWVLFVNVPIGIAVALAAPRVLAGTRGQRGRFDLPGAITGTGGLAALVYGLSNAATSPSKGAGEAGGISHWGDVKVIAALARRPRCSSRSCSPRCAARRRCCRCACCAAAVPAGHAVHPAVAGGRLAVIIYWHALAAGFARGFEVAAGILLLALIVTIAAIRVRRSDLAGAHASTTT